MTDQPIGVTDDGRFVMHGELPGLNDDDHATYSFTTDSDTGYYQSFSTQYTADRTLFIRVRDGGEALDSGRLSGWRHNWASFYGALQPRGIKAFETSGTWTSAGYSQTAVRHG